MTTVRNRRPNIRLYFPDWWHHHGSKMRVQELDLQGHNLVIAGSAAKVMIRVASQVHPEATGWFIEWEVVQYQPYGEIVRGRVQVTNEELAVAFDLLYSPVTTGDWLLDRFGGDVAEQGKYIRWQRFLNIPCPGTGNDGDPNVSIELDKEIKEVVRQLLNLQ